LGSNALKITDGGWLPLLIGIIIFIYMTTWKTGREILSKKLKEKIMPMTEFFQKLQNTPHQRAEGVCIYMNRNLGSAPYPMVHSFEHYKCLHKNIIFITVLTEQRPRVPESQRYEITFVEGQYHQLILKYGYMDNPDVVGFLNKYKQIDDKFDPLKATFIIGRENIFATDNPGMALWREKLFSFQTKMEIPSAYYFNLPKERVLEVGAQIEI
jgi:KUP system potassium uptake protein